MAGIITSSLESAVAGQIQKVIILSAIGFSELFSAAFPMDAKIETESKLTQHPLETGAIVSDHLIVQPTIITISMMIPVEYSILLTTLDNYLQTGAAVMILTKDSVYSDMVLVGKPHIEQPDKMDFLNAQLRFQQITIAAMSGAGGGLQSGDVSDKANASTVAKSQSTGASASSSASSSSVLGSAVRHAGYTGPTSNFVPTDDYAPAP